jgi:hypothetical protein
MISGHNSSMQRRLKRALATFAGVLAVMTSLAVALPATAGAATKGASTGSATSGPFLDTLHTVTNIASTVPANGDVNPYGIVEVPQTIGKLIKNHTLISNFNAKSNLQGTGTTIMEIGPEGRTSVFAQLGLPLPGACPGGVGLTTALEILGGRYVVVGSLPVTKKGMGTPEAGCLIVLNAWGKPVETWSGTLINGPWDMAVLQFPGFAQLFVTNVLNGTVAAGGNVVDEGSVVRLDIAVAAQGKPQLIGETEIATGFPEELNSSALVLGPTGDAIGAFGTLYVADTVGNRIAAIPFAPFLPGPVQNGGITVTTGGGLDSPLGMMIAPNGNIVVANGNNGNAVEVTPFGQQVADVQMDPLNSGGDLFGLTLSATQKGILFVDDGDNTLKRFSA